MVINKNNIKINCPITTLTELNNFEPNLFSHSTPIHIAKVCIFKCNRPVNIHSTFIARKSEELASRGFNGVLFIYQRPNSHHQEQQLLVLFPSIAKIERVITRWSNLGTHSKGYGQIRLIVNGQVVAEIDKDEPLSEVENQIVGIETRESQTDSYKELSLYEVYMAPDGTSTRRSIAHIRVSWEREGWFYKARVDVKNEEKLREHVDIQDIIENYKFHVENINKQLEIEFKKLFGVDFSNAHSLLKEYALEFQLKGIANSRVVNILKEIENGWKPDLKDLIDTEVDEDEYLSLGGLAIYNEDADWDVTVEMEPLELQRVLVYLILQGECEDVIIRGNRLVIYY